QKCEEGSGELARQGIDLVEAEGVTGFAVSGQRSGAEAHYTDSCRHSTVKVQRQADSGFGPVVGGWTQDLRGIQELRAVFDAGVVQRVVGLLKPVVKLLDPEGAVEVSNRNDGVLAIGVNVARQNEGHGGGDDQPKRACDPTVAPQRGGGQQGRGN